MTIWTFTAIVTFIGFCKKPTQLINRINIRYVLLSLRIISFWEDIRLDSNGIEIFPKLSDGGCAGQLVGPFLVISFLTPIKHYFLCKNSSLWIFFQYKSVEAL